MLQKSYNKSYLFKHINNNLLVNVSYVDKYLFQHSYVSQ